MKKNYLLKLSILLIAAVVSSCSIQENEHSRPNILFCILDDASWKHFGAYGCTWVNTPTFDKVASQGILFNNAYTPNAKCSPSRSIILTGRNSWQLEEAANHNPYFPEKFKTYPEVLKENGYWTGYIGKGWAPGDPGRINGQKRELVGDEFNHIKTEKPTKGISNIDYTENFKAFLKQKPDDSPFCCWLGPKEPHRKYEFNSGINKGGKKINDIDEVPLFWPDVDTVRTDMLDYAYEIEYVDRHLQKMLKHLKEIDQLKNTIVIVTSDNGMPFPRVKGQVYEYSNHIPLAIMWPNGIKKPGRIVDDIVSFIDFAPTFLDLAGLNEAETGMQPITGNSLLDIFNRNNSTQTNTKRNFVLVGKERHDVGRPNDQGYPVRGIIKDDYLYLSNYKVDRWPVGNPETGYCNCDSSPTKTYILNSRRNKGELFFWKANFGKRIEEELYHIKADPYCIHNLAQDTSLSEIKRSLITTMTNELKKQNDPRIFGKGDIFDVYKYAGKVHNYYNRQLHGEDVKTGWIAPKDKDVKCCRK